MQTRGTTIAEHEGPLVCRAGAANRAAKLAFAACAALGAPNVVHRALQGRRVFEPNEHLVDAPAFAVERRSFRVIVTSRPHEERSVRLIDASTLAKCFGKSWHTSVVARAIMARKFFSTSLRSILLPAEQP